MASSSRHSNSSNSAILTGEEIYACREKLRYMARQWMSPSLRHRLDSSDLIQETLLITLSKFSTWLGRPKHEVYRWMVSVLRNRLLNHARCDARERGHVEMELPELVQNTNDVLAAVLSAELREVVDSELDKAETQARQIFELHYYEGLGFAEIANRLNRSESAVRSVHYRLLGTIRPRIEKQFR